MKSEQAMWMVLALVVMTAGCQYRGAPKPTVLSAPYGERQVWAIVPLRNESGSLHADGLKAADQLAQRLETVMGLDTLPVNRVLVAMESLGLSGVNDAKDVSALRAVLGVDALVVGTITAYDPYDPPKLGLAIELYFDPRRESGHATNLDELVRAGTDNVTQPQRTTRSYRPVSVVSGFYDASDQAVHQKLVAYASMRSGQDEDDSAQGWRLYQIDMDLYTEFVTYLVSKRLLRVELERLAPPQLTVEPAT
jgi:hypothetical protein